MSNDRNKRLSRTKTAIEELSPPDIKRWTAQRKAAVVKAVHTGMITMDEVCRRYDLTVKEFLAWQIKMDMHGEPGLRTTRLQSYRHPRRKQGGDSAA